MNKIFTINKTKWDEVAPTRLDLSKASADFHSAKDIALANTIFQHYFLIFNDKESDIKEFRFSIEDRDRSMKLAIELLFNKAIDNKWYFYQLHFNIDNPNEMEAIFKRDLKDFARFYNDYKKTANE